jgi:hypothetical protein
MLVPANKIDLINSANFVEWILEKNDFKITYTGTGSYLTTLVVTHPFTTTYTFEVVNSNIVMDNYETDSVFAMRTSSMSNGTEFLSMNSTATTFDRSMLTERTHQFFVDRAHFSITGTVTIKMRFW